MTQRVNNRAAMFNDHPFAGAGESLYQSAVDGSVRYRNLRVVPGAVRRRRRGGGIKGSGGVHDIAAASVLKTNRVDSVTEPTAAGFSVDTSAISGIPGAVTWDVRRFDSHVENETEGFRTATVELDANGDEVGTIYGTAVLLSQTPLAGGAVKFRVRYTASRKGTTPVLLRASRTAGPSSPADATTTFDGTSQVVEITTPALSDASAYTYTISAENSGATITADLITGISVTADATGPTAPTEVGAEAW